VYTIIRRYEGVDKGKMEAAIGRVESELKPRIQQARGFVGYYLILGDDDTVATISVFEDRETAEASAREVREWVQENVADAVPNAPQVTQGDVRIGAER
jgi:hypothetical protein